MVDSKPGAASLAPCLSTSRAGLGFGGEVSAQHVLVHDNGGGLVGHCCECVAAARSCCSRVCAANTARDAQERARCSVSGVQAGSGVEVQDYVWRAPRWQRDPRCGLAKKGGCQGGVCPANYGGWKLCPRSRNILPEYLSTSCASSTPSGIVNSAQSRPDRSSRSRLNLTNTGD